MPVNEKALIQTTEGANIHMYGTGVLQKQVVLISDSIGSKWKDSIIKTPIGIYGVDADSHKIWRYSDANKLEIISDFSMQRFLHDNIDIKESEKSIILGFRNIKSHYNSFKSDVMFTYYNKDKIWNICYNERLGKWITRYSWTPYMSENIDSSMFSFDLLKTKVFGIINSNLGRNDKKDIVTVNQYLDDNDILYKRSLIDDDDKLNKFNESINKYTPGQINNDVDIVFDLNINNTYTYYNINSINVKGFYWDGNKINFDYLQTSDKVFINNIISDDDDVNTEKSLYESYKKGPAQEKHRIVFNHSDYDEKYIYFNIDIKYTPYTVAEVDEEIKDDYSVIVMGNHTLDYTIGIIKDYLYVKDVSPSQLDNYKKALLNQIFVHGRSLNADEINYFDKDPDNQCLPTKWYDTQHPFEFEIIVNEPKGLHKIFDNLMIVSNNVEPESFEVEITGDVYGFDKENNVDNPENIFNNIDIIPAEKTKNGITKSVNTRIK